MRILMYPEVTPGRPAEIHSVSPATFRAQLSQLGQGGYETVTLAYQTAPTVSHKRPTSAKLIVITFARQTVYRLAWYRRIFARWRRQWLGQRS